MSKNEELSQRNVTALQEKYEPNQNIQELTSRIRWIHAFKVGASVLIASLTVLIPTWDVALQKTGTWAVITVCIVLLPTPGDTTNKIVNRFLGTSVGAFLAIGVGLLGRDFEGRAAPLGRVTVGVSSVFVAILGTWLSSKSDRYTYAYSLGTWTYCFLVLSTMTESAMLSVFRVAMIALGGTIGFIVSWLPPNHRSHEVAKAYLVDSILDVSVCVESLIQYYVAGDVLLPVEEIYLGKFDDVVHRCSKAIQLNRPNLEAAIKLAQWETPNTSCQGYNSCGRSIRYTLRSMLAADLIIRRNYKPLNPAVASDVRLSLALSEISRAISSELGKTLLFLKWEVPTRISIDDDPNALVHAIINLKTVLTMYMAEPCSNIIDKADHIAFAQLMYDAGLMALDIIPNFNTTDHSCSMHDRKSRIVASCLTQSPDCLQIKEKLSNL